jgi:TetR/AcrR family transcriptional repressor of nem operon
MQGVSTRDKIISLGRDFIQHMGYHTFRYQLIAKELNIKNAAVHHYFPAKEDLGVAIIEKDRSDFLDLIEASKDQSAKARTEVLLTRYANYCLSGKNLDIIGACASIYSELSPKMEKAANEYIDTVESWLTDTLRAGRDAGEFRFSQTPEDIAAFWISTLPGALQVAQARGAGFFRGVLEQLRRTLRQE